MGKHTKRRSARDSAACPQYPAVSDRAPTYANRTQQQVESARQSARARGRRSEHAAQGESGLRFSLSRLDKSLLLWALGGSMLVLFAASLSGLVSADGSLEVRLPRRSASTGSGHNLVASVLGPTIRASSYMGTLYVQHHPAFLVDGSSAPTLTEKWASAKGDRSPWLELLFRGRADVARVVIQHAGAFEFAHFTARNYRLRCLDARGVGPAVAVLNNQLARSEHVLKCSDARGVRIEFNADDSPDRIVRIYEIEVLQQ
jgi:hypothetical protein